MGTSEILSSLIKIFIIIIPGYVLTRTGAIKKEHTESISSLITCVTYPCLVIDAMQTQFSAETLRNCKYLVLLFLCIIALLLVLSRIVTCLVNLPASKEGIFSFMLIFGNTGFIGVPVLGSLFGDEALLYGSLCDSLFDIFMFTIGTGSVLADVIVIQSAMPVAMCSVIFSEEYHADAAFAARGTMLTTLCCIITVPLFAVLTQIV